ncbi:hypothetical protein [Aestuariispira insulae]|uniref:Uncharacterized protein n=1 Tax=Aestuariispira insulae TaxID=1461337 RepID=A0A3D9H1E8_9PROT|nr:hypothetical protein [Aestuariispira insulae]RED43325.1 hypothetical protein DFP90_1316 [Aestuariispira insulae]
MHTKAEISGAAALTICEALLLCLKESGNLTKEQINGLLTDAVSTHVNAAEMSSDSDLHKSAAKLIEEIAAGRNSTRHL